MTVKENSASALRRMTAAGIFAAFMCIISPFAIPVGPISITLATFAVYLSGAVLGRKLGGIAVAIYLLLGFAGLPVFSGFTGCSSGSSAQLFLVSSSVMVFLVLLLVQGICFTCRGSLVSVQPVFSGFTGGIQRLFGATGGYMVGYIFCTYITGLFADKFKKIWAYPVGMVLGTAVLYAFGTAWFCLLTGSEIIPALAACVFPFLIGDAIKIAAASALAVKLRQAADRMMK